MKDFFWRIWGIGRWVLLAVIVLYVALVIYRIPFVAEQERSDEAVAFINAQAITMADVTGENLPPMPDKELNDSAIEGIDVNNNGIRDDVELAIFERYPNDVKIRAAILQYALAVQMYLTEVFNSDTLIAVAKQDERASSCIADQLSRENIQDYFNELQQKKRGVKNTIINTDMRQKRANDNTFLVRSFGSSKGRDCDLFPEELNN